jgi:acyl transferase domain-containing protein
MVYHSAGGTNLYSTPLYFQNLAAGTFLSPTGQCKPFDAQADGYCRGEAIGAVFLKKATDAIADGDQILGIISATAVNQNQNDTPIFVPNPDSLTGVFRTVIAKSKLHVRDVSFVETHGTGTPVGDPTEYDSVRQVFGGAARAGLKPLQLGSVKGLIGHTEGASGVVALIKVLLMMQESRIPPQASFNTINPAIRSSPSDNMEIAKACLPWSDDVKIAMINNYGAAGSNASIVVQQAPKLGARSRTGSERAEEKNGTLTSSASSFRCPFYISGLDDKAVQEYAEKLRQFLREKPISGHSLGIENVSFNVNRQSANQSLGRAAIFAAESINDLEQQLSSLETCASPGPGRPVILCFGGQVAKSVGLDREVFEKCAILRHHLDECDAICKSIQAGSIYPAIFNREDITDASILQPLLFSMQYACAKSWQDCGVEPAALVGHSFGELTALCISGVWSLEDALRMIHGRSKIIRDAWGAEKGSMIAIDADLADLQQILAAANATLDTRDSKDGHGVAAIACVNGPRSYTLAGSVAAMDAVQQNISTREVDTTRPMIKHKRLSVTNAFHSALIEPLKPALEDVGRKLTFGQPRIPVERETEEHEECPSDASYIADQMRDPIYWYQTVQRLATKYPNAIWLEAGSNSTIASMASKALGMPKSAVFVPVNVTSDTNALQNLVDATMALWSASVQVSFWPHSRAQTQEYAPIMLPPYQFAKNRHWLDFKPPLRQIAGEAQPSAKTSGSVGGEALPPTGPFTFVGYKDSTTKKEARFLINTLVKTYDNIVSGHVLAKAAPVFPVPFAIDLAIQAVTRICPEMADVNNKLQPTVYSIVNPSPLIRMDSPGTVFLDLECPDDGDVGAVSNWIFKFVSTPVGEAGEETMHIRGQLLFQHRDDGRLHTEFSRLGRFVTHERCLRALQSNDESEEVIQGRSIYKVGNDLVHYGERFRGLQKLVGRANESAGRLVRRRAGEACCFDPAFADAFEQVGSIWANCMARERLTTDESSIYLISEVEQWIQSPDLEKSRALDNQEQWDVLAQHKRLDSGDFLTDIFVFDPASGSLQMAMLGIRYKLVPT